MLKLNDTVLYGTTGVCTVSNIEEKKIGRVTRKYYVLKPVAQSSSTIFVPADNDALLSKIRDVLAADEVKTLLEKSKTEEGLWIENDDERKNAYNEMIVSGDRLGYLRILKALKNHQNDLSTKGKRLHLVDERIMKEAQRLIFDEFSYALNMTYEEVTDFLKEQLQ